jgi:cell division protein FtsZ
VQKAAAENANIIFGAVHDESMGDAVKVTVIATGIKSERMGIKPLAGPSAGIRTAQQIVKNHEARKEKLPVEVPPPITVITENINEEEDLDKPTFLRRRKEEKK